MSAVGCGDPDGCPVPARADVPPPTQMSRFAVLRNQPHVDVARHEMAALLDSHPR